MRAPGKLAERHAPKPPRAPARAPQPPHAPDPARNSAHGGQMRPRGPTAPHRAATTHPRACRVLPRPAARTPPQPTAGFTTQQHGRAPPHARLKAAAPTSPKTAAPGPPPPKGPAPTTQAAANAAGTQPSTGSGAALPGSGASAAGAGPAGHRHGAAAPGDRPRGHLEERREATEKRPRRRRQPHGLCPAATFGGGEGRGAWRTSTAALGLSPPESP